MDVIAESVRLLDIHLTSFKKHLKINVASGVSDEPLELFPLESDFHKSYIGTITSAGPRGDISKTI